jgi:hypothetical protein
VARFTTHAIIEAPCERVFDYRLDVMTLPEYNLGVVGLRRVSGDPGAEGSVYEFKVGLMGPVRVQVRLRVGKVDRPRRIEFLMESVYPAREVCTFAPVAGRPGATRVEFEATVATPEGPVGRLMDALFAAPNLRRQVGAELVLMKERLERGSSVSPQAARASPSP